MQTKFDMRCFLAHDDTNLESKRKISNSSPNDAILILN